MECCFELSIGNADKGLLPLSEIQQRVAQFTAAALPLVITQVGGLVGCPEGRDGSSRQPACPW